jgi:hypothetical protein
MELPAHPLGRVHILQPPSQYDFSPLPTDAPRVDERLMACAMQSISECMRGIQRVGGLLGDEDIEAFQMTCLFHCNFPFGSRITLGLDVAACFGSDAWRKSCGETFQRWPESVITVTV